jgi:hypothetical protein
MDVDQRTAVADEIRRMLASGAQHPEIAAYLRRAGCDSGEAVALMAVVCGMRVSQAKSVIFQSPFWFDERKRVAEFHDELGEIGDR